MLGASGMIPSNLVAATVATDGTRLGGTLNVVDTTTGGYTKPLICRSLGETCVPSPAWKALAIAMREQRFSRVHNHSMSATDGSALRTKMD